MKDVLSKIMQPATAPQMSATVLRRLAPGRYELRDDLGRVVQADSDLAYAPGATVLIQSGRIVARAAATTAIRTYEV
mgnify:CR=1 FL=1